MLSKLKRLNQLVVDELVASDWYWKSGNGTVLLVEAVEKMWNKYGMEGRVLDVGAGRVVYRDKFEEWGGEYVGLDVMGKWGVDVVGDGHKMPVANSSVEVVFCSQVLEHVRKPGAVIKEFFRVLKPGGWGVVTVPMMGYIHNAPNDYWRFTEYSLEMLAVEAGFEVVEIKPLGGLMSFLGYLRSTLLMPLFGIPYLGRGVLAVNYWVSKVEIWLDKVTGNGKVLPLDYVLVVRKK